MTALVLCWFVVAAASWLMATESAAGLSLAYLLAGLVVLIRLIWAALRLRRVPISRVWSWVVLILPVLWYLCMLLVEPMEQAARRHWSEIAGAVMPGLMLGMAASMAVNERLRETDASAQRRFARRSAGVVLGLAITVLVMTAFLWTNAEEGILLVSASLLAGAETYQILGDALTVAVLLVFVLSSMDGACLAARGWPARVHRFALPLNCLATLGCAVLIGSNKLLLIASVVGALVAWRMFMGQQRSPRRRALVIGLSVLLAVGVLILATRSELVSELLALTRLLDYGNVESLLDTPSIAARADILGSCGISQFQLAPWGGDLAAEFRTCGDGYYIHSLLSIQTHLGLVGSLLFASILGRGAWLIQVEPGYHGLRLPFWLVLGIGIIGAYFTWLPFWFLLGLVAGLYRQGQGGEANASSAQT